LIAVPDHSRLIVLLTSHRRDISSDSASQQDCGESSLPIFMVVDFIVLQHQT
jgi:hypothetical protein